MKEYCLIFDTNIITENKNKLSEIKEKIEEIADIYIPKIVIEEVQAQKSRSISDDYLKIQGIIKKNKDSFIYEEKFKLSDVITKSENAIEEWLKNYCNNILEYKKVDMNDILSRLKYKKAPFINEIGSSDKGFKDTIIWLSIMEKESLQEYKKIILITNDKTGFVKRREELYEEYKERYLTDIRICSSIEEVYQELEISSDEQQDIQIENHKIQEQKNENIQDIKKELNSCIDHIVSFVYDDNWGNEQRVDRFVIYTKMKDEDIECFLILLGDYLKENLFFERIDMSDILFRCGIESAGETVRSKYLNELNEIYIRIKDNRDLYKPFIKFIKENFNSLYKPKPANAKTYIDELDNIDPEDLPF